MIRKKILIVEDEAPAARMLREYLTPMCDEIMIAANGKEALDLFRSGPCPVVITDIEMPVMDGNELVSHLKLFAEPPVIFITTSHRETGLIIDIMKKGVYDYLLKPIDGDDLCLKVKRAFEAYELQHEKRIVEHEKVLRLQHQLEWYRWQERVTNRTDDAGHASLFSVLQTSFNQGAGFGILISLLNLLNSTAVKHDNGYLINEKLFALIQQNSRMAEKALNTFAEIDNMMNRDLVLEETGIDEFYGILESRVVNAGQCAGIRNNRIILSDNPAITSKGKIRIDRSTLTMAIDEVLLNACKFSVRQTPVPVLFSIHEEKITLSIINTPEPDDEGRKGIPHGYENLVFEPFFRLTKRLNENYNSLDFGLGLTLAEHIIRKHSGTIEIGNVIDYSRLEAEPSLRVSCDIQLPLVR